MCFLSEILLLIILLDKEHTKNMYMFNDTHTTQEVVAVDRIIIITLSSNHRVEIHFLLWRLHKNTVFKSHSNACIQ